MKKIIAVEDGEKCMEEVEKLIDVVFNGFMALAMDYGYHIKSTFGSAEEGKNMIFELRENIHYRLNSSKLHLYLLLRRKMDIDHRFARMLQKNPNVFDGFFMGNPYFEFAADEIMSIYDSIIFHLSSAFDYLAMLLQFVFGKNPQTNLQWITLVKHCHAEGSDFCNRLWKENVKVVDRDFVSKFNDYRAELIHRKKSTAFANASWELQSGKVLTKFQCSAKIKSAFKKILEKEKEYCISYVSFSLIKHAVLQIGHVLEGVKDEFSTNYNPHAPVLQEGVIQLGMYNPATRYMESPSGPYWERFMKYKK